MSEVTIGEWLSHRILPSESDLLKTDLHTGNELVNILGKICYFFSSEKKLI